MRARRPVAVLAAVAGLAACGVPSEGAPRDIAVEALPNALQSDATTTTSVAPSQGATVDREIFVTRQTDTDSSLHRVAVPVVIPLGADPREEAVLLIDALVDQRTETLAADHSSTLGLQNRVPLDTQVLNAELRGNGVLVLDFSKQLTEAVQGEGQRMALAQILFTATGVPGINAVVFKVEGVDQAVQVETSTKEAGTPITRADFEKLNNAVNASAGTG